MGLFDRKVKVHVSGRRSLFEGADGRYSKQVAQQKKREKQKIRELVFEPHTPAELRGYIESKYGVKELEKSDERYKKAYMSVKPHLVFLHHPELVKTEAIPEPSHPPVSEHDPDYEEYRANETARWKEAVMLPQDVFKMHLHVYNISLMQGDKAIAWLEISVETEYEHLSFNTTYLDYEDHYQVNRIIRDIVDYFGISKEDKKAKNERYLQYLSVR